MNTVKNVWRTISFASTAAALALTATPAFAAKPVNPPTLHGFCATANPCSDNGTNTPTDVNPPVFGFSAGGHDATGDVTIAILVPDSLSQPGSFAISGYASGTASLFSGTAWTTGELDDYLGISASPTNPIGAFLPTTLTFQPGADGFWVYLADLGTITLPANPGSDSFLLTLDQSLGLGSYVVAYINQDGNYGATANSGAILEDGSSVPEPATWAMMLVGFGAAGVAMRRRRKAAVPISQLA
jgi:hypothetical protein